MPSLKASQDSFSSICCGLSRLLGTSKTEPGGFHSWTSPGWPMSIQSSSWAPATGCTLMSPLAAMCMTL
jgi:hypothetical protein